MFSSRNATNYASSVVETEDFYRSRFETSESVDISVRLSSRGDRKSDAESGGGYTENFGTKRHAVSPIVSTDRATHSTPHRAE